MQSLCLTYMPVQVKICFLFKLRTNKSLNCVTWREIDTGAAQVSPNLNFYFAVSVPVIYSAASFCAPSLQPSCLPQNIFYGELLCYSKMTTANLVCCFNSSAICILIQQIRRYLLYSIKEISINSGLHTQGESHFKVGQVIAVGRICFSSTNNWLYMFSILYISSKFQLCVCVC